MQAPATPDNEIERLQSLIASGLLNEQPDAGFDRFTRLAQALFGCKISLLSLVDEKRQWFKSRQGLAATETPRDVSFCAHAVFNDKLLYIPDATADQRFADNPLVTGEPAIRLYAGVPLHSVDGLPLGTLCIIDDIPRELNTLQLTLLQDLAALAEAEIARNTLASQATQLERDKALLEQHRQRLAAFIDSSRLATWEWNVQTGDAIFNERWAEMLGYDLYDLLPLSVDTWLKLVHPTDKAHSERLLQRHFAGELPFYELECRMQHKNGHWVWVLTQGKVISRTDQGQPRLMTGTHQDISERKANEAAITEAYSLLQRVCRNAGLDISSSDKR
ncbi:PAS domain-containing protein [Rheinheimera sp. YQF-2]|uniref:PAS domain-containing protein n=1 Tax=Rheinheimera lutimaris TaxID=2740584 RepID=A0A7Y5ARR4_9GAMM|nr:PAS domain-containing protein [Rheinheimera lutimaris]NRQ43332.1 PAS domain-containing protein [Rheinheimera lutimaris]